MESKTRKETLRSDIIVEKDIYGKYNRKILAFTKEYGLIVSVMTEADTQYAPLGKHLDALIELEHFYSGTVLVGRIVPEVDA